MENARQERICIYHGNCQDGFAAATIVKNKYPDAEFIAGVYQTPPPDVSGKDVIIVDFSYKRPVMEKMLEQCNSMVWIDHHLSAIADLEGMNSAKLDVFISSMNAYSGAALAWMYYHPGIPIPRLVQHIDDRDRWQFKLMGTREIAASLFSLPYDFGVYMNMIYSKSDGMLLRNLQVEGEAIERKHFKDIKELLSIVTRTMRIGGYDVPVANLPYTMSSDAGHTLAKGKPFGACYWDTPAGRIFSLRSEDNAVDVSKIAVLYGGGGHMNAAGFTVPYEVAATFEIGKS